MNAKPKMTKRQREAAIARDIKLEAKVRKNVGSYTYFISGLQSIGYTFTLVDRDNNTLCSSPVYASTAEVLKTLRRVQRHAATTDIRDETP